MSSASVNTPELQRPEVILSSRYRSPFRFLREFSNDKLGFLLSLRSEGDVVSFKFGPRYVHFLFHPDHVRYVLQENHRNYIKETFSRRMLTMFVGNGLFTSQGELWLNQRRMAQPAFHRRQMAALTSTIADITNEMLQRWEKHAAAGDVVDISSETMGLALEIAARTLFGAKFEIPRGFVDVLAEAFAYVDYRVFHPLAAPAWIPTRRNRRFKRAIRKMDAFASQIIAASKISNSGSDLLTLLLAENRERDLKQVRDQIITFIGAGSETTAATLAWAFYALGHNPEVRLKLRSEIDEKLARVKPLLDDLRSLNYTQAVIQETLRLYPPAYITSRMALSDDVIAGKRIPAGSVVLIGIYPIHRDPRFWEEPERFNPERFLNHNSRDRTDHAFLPFGAGPRHCIGEDFARMEATIVLAMIMQSYDFELAPGAAVTPEPMFSLRPRPGVFGIFTKHAR